jgi:hypothetical protein
MFPTVPVPSTLGTDASDPRCFAVTGAEPRVRCETAVSLARDGPRASTTLAGLMILRVRRAQLRQCDLAHRTAEVARIAVAEVGDAGGQAVLPWPAGRGRACNAALHSSTTSALGYAPPAPPMLASLSRADAREEPRMSEGAVDRGVVLLTSVGGCFSPNVSPDAGDDSPSSDTTVDLEEGTGPSSMTAPGTTNGTTDGPTSSGSGDPQTGATETNGVDQTSTGADTESSEGTPPPEPFCGDGSVDDGEQCDEGDANAINAGCLPDCTAASCGDGYIFDGSEACDDGMGFNVLQLGACAPDCSRVIEEKRIARGDTASADLGANLTRAEMDTVRIKRDSFHGEWNYTILPGSRR